VGPFLLLHRPRWQRLVNPRSAASGVARRLNETLTSGTGVSIDDPLATPMAALTSQLAGSSREDNEFLVGYACQQSNKISPPSTTGCTSWGVGDDRSYGDHGLTSTNRHLTGLGLAVAACWAGDTLIVTKLDRLARSLPDACDISTADQAEVELTSSAAPWLASLEAPFTRAPVPVRPLPHVGVRLDA
jgi:Resolvase, N terminal domain